MLGFEISFNEEVIRTSIDNGLMEIIFMGGGLDRKRFDLEIFNHERF